jgi:putative membrane protein
MGVTPPEGPNAKQITKKVKNARADSSIAISQAHMVADHKKHIAEYKKASKSGDAAREYAKGNRAVLQR